MGRNVTQVAFGVLELPRDKNVAAYCRVSSGKDAMLHLALEYNLYKLDIENSQQESMIEQMEEGTSRAWDRQVCKGSGDQ